MGPSGSGKSTLMHCLAGLDTATSGRSFIGDVDLTDPRRQGADPAAPGQGRLHLPGVQPGADADARSRTSRCRWTSPAASRTRSGSTRSSTPSACGDRLSHRPSELSGGQQQRVACARALAQPARDRLRRRADRQPRLPVRRRGPGLPAALGARDGPDGRDGHPRPGGRRLRRPGALPGRRPDRRRDARPDGRGRARPDEAASTSRHSEATDRCSESPSRACSPTSSGCC